MSLYKIAVDTAAIGNGHSIAAYLTDNAGALLTSTLVGADQALDVNVVLSVLPTGAATEASVASLLSEIQALSHAESSAHSSGHMGMMPLGVRNDAGTPLAADGQYIPFMFNSSGALYTSSSIDFAGDYLEDSVAANSDAGIFGLYVRRDSAGSNVSATGDYAEGQVSGTGEFRSQVVMDTANLQQLMTVGVLAVALPTASLVHRKKLIIQNIGDKPIYIGAITVTATGATRGREIHKGGEIEVEVGPNNVIYGICATAEVANVVIHELS